MNEDEFRIAAFYQTAEGEQRCMVIGGRGDMLAGRPGATAGAIAEADATFDPTKPVISLCLNAGISLRDMDPEVAVEGRSRTIPRACIEYPWAMVPKPLADDQQWDGWPWRGETA